MADSIPIFDPDVFDFAYDLLTGPAIAFRVENSERIAKPGQTVSITITLVEKTTTPGRTYPISLPAPVQISYYTPSNTLLDTDAMVEVGPGMYTAIRPTLTTDPVGAYSAVFLGSFGTTTLITDKIVVFTLI